MRELLRASVTTYVLTAHCLIEQRTSYLCTGCPGEGLITYMRTDGLQLAASAVEDIRSTVERLHGSDYLPDAPRTYK